ncbi:MAG: hypothetical protein NVS1B10_05870 [Candidatus Saccharimonadales bacterium]
MVEQDLFDTSKQKQKKLRMVLRMATDLVEKEIEWLVPRYLAKGMLHCVAGFAGDGKSSVLTSIIAQISKGQGLVNGDLLAGGPASVAIITEEPLELQALPRLNLAGADLLKVGFIDGIEVREGEDLVPWNLVDHVADARAFFTAHPHFKLLVLDPIGNYMAGRGKGREIDTWKDADVRYVLAPWQKLAEEFNIVILFVAHFNKGKTARPIEKITGSGAFTTVTRMTYLVGRPGEEWLEKFGYEKVFNDKWAYRTLHTIKCNIGREPAPIVFRFEEVPNKVNPKVYVAGFLPLGVEQDLADAIMGGEKGVKVGEEKTIADRVLTTITENPGLNSSDIAALVKISATNLSPILKALEIEDKIKRVQNGRESWIYPFMHPTLDLLD